MDPHGDQDIIEAYKAIEQEIKRKLLSDNGEPLEDASKAIESVMKDDLQYFEKLYEFNHQLLMSRLVDYIF